MDRETYRARLKQGVEVWNIWRKSHPDIIPDLHSTDLHGWDLREAVLDRVDLRGANLYQADLRGAVLRGARLDDSFLIEACLQGADFREATLENARLNYADLRGAIMRAAFIKGGTVKCANLSCADLASSNFTGANLIDANLTGANLIDANLTGAELFGADLSESRLVFATFQSTFVKNACFRNATFGSTKIGGTDLSGAKALETAVHAGPSTIGVDTIYLSGGKISDEFLRNCGVPDLFIDYANSLIGNPISYYSCFISHSSQDSRFVDRLCKDLKASHVPTWYFPQNARWGETVWGEIDRNIRLYDKLVLVCSENSLQSQPVLAEIERALQREQAEKKNVLFPITIDDHIFNDWDHERKADVIKKIVGDFRDWNHGTKEYQESFQRLLSNLNAE